MAKFDFSQTIKEKRLIDEAMKYDDCARKEIASRFNELREKFKDNEKLRGFYTQGIVFLSTMFDFLLPMNRLLSIFKEKYPHALFISGCRHAFTEPDEYSDVVCARHDEVYDALVAMDVTYAAQILSEAGIADPSLTQLTNALSTKNKQSFLDLLSQCNLPELFLQSFKNALYINESLSAMSSFVEAYSNDAFSDGEFLFGLRTMVEENVREVVSKSESRNEYVRAALTLSDRLVDAIELLSIPDDDKAQAYILDIEDPEEYLGEAFMPMFANIFELSRYFYPFLNDYERESVDIMMRERKGCITIEYFTPEGEKSYTLNLRGLLDDIIEEIPYDKPFEKVQANICQEEAEKCTANADADIALISTPPAENAIQSPQIGFPDMYAKERTPLQYSCLLKIAQELAGNGVGSSFKKKFIDQQDVLKFCWFFNEGYNESGKPLDLTKKIQWLSDAGSLKYLIKLLYGAKSKSDMATFIFKEGLKECVVSVFEYQRQRKPKKTDLKNLIRHFSDAEEASLDDKKVLIEIASKYVPWKDEITL